MRNNLTPKRKIRSNSSGKENIKKAPLAAGLLLALLFTAACGNGNDSAGGQKETPAPSSQTASRTETPAENTGAAPTGTHLPADTEDPASATPSPDSGKETGQPGEESETPSTDTDKTQTPTATPSPEEPAPGPTPGTTAGHPATVTLPPSTPTPDVQIPEDPSKPTDR